MQCSFTPPLTPDDGSPLPFNEREEDCYVCCTISDIGPVGPPDFEEPVLQPQDGFPCICAGMEEFCPYCAWERELAERSQAPRRSSDLTLVATLSGPPSLQDTSSETPSQSQDSFQVLATATPPANDARRKLRKSRRVSSTPRVVSLALSSQSDATSSHTESFSSTSPDSPLLPSPKPGKALKKQQTPASPKEQTLPQNDAASSSTKSVSIIRSRSLLRVSSLSSKLLKIFLTVFLAQTLSKTASPKTSIAGFRHRFSHCTCLDRRNAGGGQPYFRTSSARSHAAFRVAGGGSTPNATSPVILRTRPFGKSCIHYEAYLGASLSTTISQSPSFLAAERA